MTAQRDWQQGDEFSYALREAIAARGLALDRIRYRLRQRGHQISVATLSYWQSGRSRPERATSLAALGTLEEILEVPRGSLAIKLPPPRRRAAQHHGEDDLYLGSLHAQAHLMDDMIEELGLSWTGGINRISAHDLIDIRVDQTAGSHMVRELIQATEDGIDRLPVGLLEDDPAIQPYLIASRNCRVGRVLEVPEAPAFVGELVLERPLRAGEAVLIEYYLMTIGQSAPRTWWARGCLKQQRELHLEVRFDEAAVPVAAESFINIDGHEHATPVHVVGSKLSVLRVDFGPGSFGVRWIW